MGAATWIRRPIAALVAVIGVACAVRLLAGGRGRTRPAGAPDRHEDVGHLLMGVGMLVMLLSWTAVVPRPVWLVLVLAMAPDGASLSSAAEHAMVGWQPLALSFALYFLAYTVWSGARLVTDPVTTTGGVAGWTPAVCRPRLVEACRAGMGLGMTYMMLVPM